MQPLGISCGRRDVRRHVESDSKGAGVRTLPDYLELLLKLGAQVDRRDVK